MPMVIKLSQDYQEVDMGLLTCATTILLGDPVHTQARQTLMYNQQLNKC